MTKGSMHSSLHEQPKRVFNMSHGPYVWKEGLTQGSYQDAKQNLVLSSVCRSHIIAVGIIAGCVGFTLLVLAVIGLVYLALRKKRVQKLNPKSEKSFQIETPNGKIKMDAALSA